jgi:hypothetical protein
VVEGNFVRLAQLSGADARSFSDTSNITPRFELRRSSLFVFANFSVAAVDGLPDSRFAIKDNMMPFVELLDFLVQVVRPSGLLDEKSQPKIVIMKI